MDEIRSPADALRRAVSVAGSQVRFGKLIGVGQPSISKWLANDVSLPAEHVLKVEAETGVSRHDLRPDLYPRESAPAHAGDAA